MSLEPTSTTQPRLPRRGRKYFTVAEANRSLAYVSRVVKDLIDRYRLTLDLRERIENPREEDAQEKLRRDYEVCMDRLGTLVEEIHQVGAEVKDFEKGLLDFPAIHQGREIYLCWRHGEPRIQAWHEVDAGYAGRQAVDVLDR